MDRSASKVAGDLDSLKKMEAPRGNTEVRTNGGFKGRHVTGEQTAAEATPFLKGPVVSEAFTIEASGCHGGTGKVVAVPRADQWVAPYQSLTTRAEEAACAIGIRGAGREEAAGETRSSSERLSQQLALIDRGCRGDSGNSLLDSSSNSSNNAEGSINAIGSSSERRSATGSNTSLKSGCTSDDSGVSCTNSSSSSCMDSTQKTVDSSSSSNNSANSSSNSRSRKMLVEGGTVNDRNGDIGRQANDTYCSMLPSAPPDSSIDTAANKRKGGLRLNNNSSNSTAEEGETAAADGHIGNSNANSVEVVAERPLHDQQEEGDKDIDEDEEDDETLQKKQPWRGVLGIDELLAERDDDILQLLAKEEPTIPDDLCRYYLHRVGCATVDRTVARLISVAAQLQVERVIEDAKAFSYCMQRTAATTSPVEQPWEERKQRAKKAEGAISRESDELTTSGESPDDVSVLDIGSLCAALQKNDDNFCGLSLDCFLDAAPVFLQGEMGCSAAVEPQLVEGQQAPVTPPYQETATASVTGVPVGDSESELFSAQNTFTEAPSYTTAGAVSYPVSVRPRGRPNQPSSERLVVTDSSTSALLPASQAQSIYRAAAEMYDVHSAAIPVDARSSATVAPAAAVAASDGVGGASVVPVKNGYPIASNSSYASPVTAFPGSAARTIYSAATRSNMGVINIAGQPGSAVAEGVAAGAGVNASFKPRTNTATDSSATGKLSFDISAATTPSVGGVTGTSDGVVVGQSAPTAVGAAFGTNYSNFGVLRAYQGINPVSSAVAAAGTRVSVNNIPFADSSAGVKGGTAQLRAGVSVDTSSGSLSVGHLRVAGGFSVGSALDASSLSGALPVYPPGASTQPSLTIGAVVPPLPAADRAATALFSDGSETSRHPSSEATASSGTVDMKNRPASMLLRDAPSSAVPAGHSHVTSALRTATLQSAAAPRLQPSATFSDQVSASIPVEPTGTCQSSIVFGRVSSRDAASGAPQSVGAAVRGVSLAAGKALSAKLQSSGAS